MNLEVSALVLAAGFGNRLKPWTDECAKPLIPVAGVEALFYALYRISKAGIKRTFVNTHYKSEQIERDLKNFHRFFPELSIKTSYEKEILGTGGAILNLIENEALKGGLLIINGDTLSSLSLKPLLKTGSCFSVSYDENFFKRYNPVYVDSQANYAGLEKKAGLRAAHFLGAHYLSESDLQLIKSKGEAVRSVDLFSGIYKVLVDEKRPIQAIEFLPSVSTDDFWFDLTNRDFLLEAKSKLAGPYFPLWRDILEKRHPSLKREDALNYWPLKTIFL